MARLLYSRNGQFQMDQNGYIVNAQGHKLNRLSGQSADRSDCDRQHRTVATVYRRPSSPLPPATSQVGLNLDSRETVPTTAIFNPTDPTSYNRSTAMTIFDSLGNNHVATLYFQKVG